MRQVIIHAGFNKTATSSIQETCANNQDKLEKLGFYYPLFKLGDRVISNHSAPFYSLFTSKKAKSFPHYRWGVDTIEANQKYEEQLNHIFQQNHEKILISGEGISNLTRLELDRMRKKIQSYNYDVRVIIFVRSPGSQIHSEVQQKVKSGHSIEKFSFSKKSIIIDKIESVFPEAEFFSFRNACQHKDGPVGYFFERIGVAKSSSLKFLTSNESLSAQATRLISFINKEQPFFLKDKKINSYRRSGDVNIFRKIKGDKFQLNKNELQKFIDKINEENDYLLSRFDTSFCDQNLLLQLEKQESNWSDEQLEQLKSLMSKLDDNIKMISYDYFKNIIGLDPEKLSYLFLKNNQIIEKRRKLINQDQ